MGLEYYSDENFVSGVEDKIFHGFFSRKGGVGEGIYESLNCAFLSKEEPLNIRKNRELIASEIGVASENFISLKQIHSKICLDIDTSFNTETEAPEADAFVTDKQGIALGILTADCAPVLFHGSTKEGKSIVGAAHSGWGGALKGVLEETVVKMRKKGAELSSIKAIVGPCINVASYEVSEEFLKPFIGQDPENDRFFKDTSKDGFYHFDLEGYCASRLASCGVSNVILTSRDTYAMKDDYFSYRRATHNGDSDYGRQASVICIR